MAAIRKRFSKWKESIKEKAEELEEQSYSVYIAYKDKRTPWYAKALAFFILAYALSPIDLIPDFIPVIGYLDDLLIVPAGIALLIKIIPKKVMDDSRKKAKKMKESPKKGWAIAVVVATWILILFLIGRGIYNAARR